MLQGKKDKTSDLLLPVQHECSTDKEDEDDHDDM